MRAGNMAGQKRPLQLKLLRNMIRFGYVLTVLTVQLQNVSAQAESSVLTVADSNWTLILEGEWMLKFYAPWCPACQHIQADWEAFAKLSHNLGISVGNVDVTQQPVHPQVPLTSELYSPAFIKHIISQRKGLSGRFLVTSLPTIFQMSGMAGLFRLSVWIRQIHTYLTNSLGIPSWGSYVIFAIVTLFLGLLLGLMLVLIADCICPSRPKYKGGKTVVLQKDEGSEDELEDTLTEEKHASDLDNDGEKVSGEEEFTEEEGSPGTEAAAGSDERSTETSVRKRKPPGPNSPKAT